jgi:hypothetical protein
MTKLATPDLTQYPPRSSRVPLGGYVHLPRLLDKARAFAVGKHGEYNYNCPRDRQFFDFAGISDKVLLAQIKRGKSDTEIIDWIETRTKRTPAEIAAWSAWMTADGPGNAYAHGRYRENLEKSAPGRKDIRTFFDLLDLDDYVTFGGRP